MSTNKPIGGYREEIVKKVNHKEQQKIKARKEGGMNSISWLGMIGIVGWSVTVPLLSGIAAGMWIDSRFPSGYSWTIMLLFAGLVAGCMNAWFWVKKSLQLKKNGTEVEKEKK